VCSFAALAPRMAPGQGLAVLPPHHGLKLQARDLR
jgi:hypothetical protein